MIRDASKENSQEDIASWLKNGDTVRFSRYLLTEHPSLLAFKGYPKSTIEIPRLGTLSIGPDVERDAYLVKLEQA